MIKPGDDGEPHELRQHRGQHLPRRVRHRRRHRLHHRPNHHTSQRPGQRECHERLEVRALGYVGDDGRRRLLAVPRERPIVARRYAALGRYPVVVVHVRVQVILARQVPVRAGAQVVAHEPHEPVFAVFVARLVVVVGDAAVRAVDVGASRAGDDVRARRVVVVEEDAAERARAVQHGDASDVFIRDVFVVASFATLAHLRAGVSPRDVRAVVVRGSRRVRDGPDGEVGHERLAIDGGSRHGRRVVTREPRLYGASLVGEAVADEDGWVEEQAPRDGAAQRLFDVNLVGQLSMQGRRVVGRDVRGGRWGARGPEHGEGAWSRGGRVSLCDGADADC
mmetsp:Transcript_12208/g.47438  ORF Transcript_12208/g.47438 Transcript_12208/m.47438 type:complete len:336 (-) Transcript_12208:626-1633(-)